MRIFSTPKIIRYLFPKILWRINTRERAVYLTFDDGPTPNVTEWVLDLLAENQAKGTFFCIGERVLMHKGIYDKVLDKGHSVGNHSFSHEDAWKVSHDAYVDDVKKAKTIIESSLFRPPYGKLTYRSYLYCRNSYKVVLWDIITHDWDMNVNTDAVLAYLKKKTNAGSIIVFHDSEKAFLQMKKILPEYLAWLKENGYVCKKIEH
ncbi:MAG: polysaccharide deacetylase family protein [Chitinophagales bacterium]|nr:polysaccharide deacetylase family protein [Chitinophagales bacterium]